MTAEASEVRCKGEHPERAYGQPEGGEGAHGATIESPGHKLARWACGIVAGFVGVKLILVLVGLALLPPIHAPVPEQQRREQVRQEERLSSEAEEEARQREYARPGGPAPTIDWQP